MHPPASPAAMTSWIIPLARAVPALALAGVVTFMPDHSAPIGYLTFGGFGVLSGLVLLVGAILAGRGTPRALGYAQAGITLAAGVWALLSTSAGLPFLVFLVTAFAALTALIELYLGLRSRGRGSEARDRLFTGGLTAALAIGLLLVPPDLAQPLGGIEAVDGVLTASVVVVGALGAYGAILGVYLVIAGLTLKWESATAAPRTAGSNA